MSYPQDFCVICAKSEELQQVMEIFDQQFERKRGRFKSDQLYVVPTKSGTSAANVPGEYTILATTCVGMGHMNAAIRTAQVINNNQPGILLFVGTAATLKPSEIQIGDVVIPRKAINRFYEKVSEKGQDDYEQRIALVDFKETFFENSNALISDIATINCSPEALSTVASIPFTQVALEHGQLGKVKIANEEFQLRQPKIFDDVDIFSCGMVVDSVSYRTFLTSMVHASMRKVGIIDMESYGFFNAIEAGRDGGVGSNCAGIMIRGISDYAGRKQQTETLPDDWKKKAVRNAAIVASSLISRVASV